MAPSQQVAFQPSLAAVFAQYFHQPSIGAKFVVNRDSFCHKAAFCCFQHGIQAVRVRFIGAEHTKVFGVHPDNVAEKVSKLARSFCSDLSGPGNFQGIICKVRNIQRSQQPPPRSHGDCRPCGDYLSAREQPIRREICRCCRIVLRACSFSSKLQEFSGAPGSRGLSRGGPGGSGRCLQSGHRPLLSCTSIPWECARRPSARPAVS